MSRVYYKIGEKTRWIEVTQGRHDQTVESKLQFLSDIYAKTDLECIMIKVVRA